MKEGNDPRWQEFAVSLRRGVSFVKMPLTGTRFLIAALTRICDAHKGESPYRELLELRNFLYGELLASNELAKTVPQHCLFYRQLVAETSQDAKLLRIAEDQDQTGLLRQFATALERGAEGDSDLDWISRVGGPPPGSPLEGLARESDAPIVLELEDLLDTH